MAQHTPGPWAAEADDRVPDRGAVYVQGPEGWSEQPICDCASFNDVETDEANARLIAAAPDLLDAIKGLIGFIEIDRLRINGDALQIARAAIAKATEAVP